MMTFWKGWESWEKIVFVLACSMVLVIIVGSFVAAVSRWKINLYNRAFAEEAKRSEHMWKQQSGLHDAPFGARALESGVYVDGVYSPRQYASRQNLARQGVNKSPASSIHPSAVSPTAFRPGQQHRGPF